MARADAVLVLVMAGVVLAVAFGFFIAYAAGVRWVPVCAEDVVLEGSGDFERGRWSGYVCGPAVDDYLEPTWAGPLALD